MTRNQKIALGCGGAGCLGLIVVAIAGGLIYYFMSRSPYYRNYNYNVSTNRNSNSNDNSDFTANSNDNTNTNDNDNSSNTNSSASSMSDDDKHKLYHAAGMTGDTEVIRRVAVKIGVMDDDFTPGDNYTAFITEHAAWVYRNAEFVQSINTAEKARAYLNEHME